MLQQAATSHIQLICGAQTFMGDRENEQMFVTTSKSLPHTGYDFFTVKIVELNNFVTFRRCYFVVRQTLDLKRTANFSPSHSHIQFRRLQTALIYSLCITLPLHYPTVQRP
jgi:hypothetical protein